jgi:hypothetical protein
MRVGRKEVEGRVEVGNEVIRLDFDPRTSDTMYNYIWVKRADTGPPPSPRPSQPSPRPSPIGGGEGRGSPLGRGGGGEGYPPADGQAGRWERVHNFGIDVGAYRSDTGLRPFGFAQGGEPVEPQAQPALSSPKGGELINTIGMNLILSQEGRSMRVRYPHPLIQYRQFDDKIGTPEKVAKYPDFKTEEMPGLVHAEASVEFLYEVDAERPSFVVSGRVLEGEVHHVVYIIDALWTDNHALPTHEYIEAAASCLGTRGEAGTSSAVGPPRQAPAGRETLSVAEFDIRTPEGVCCRDVEVEGVAFALFYRQDGNGVPFALLPQSPERARFCNYYDNWKCHYDFRAASLNQQFIPQAPPVTGCNDTGYIVSPREDGTLPGVRIAFFPESGWGRGGERHQLRGRLVAAIREL